MFRYLRGKGGEEEADRQEKKQRNYWCITDFFFFFKKWWKSLIRKKHNWNSGIHASCFTSFPALPVRLSSTWGLWWPQEESTSQGGAAGGGGAWEEKPLLSFCLSQPCALGSCAVWLFLSGEQVRWISWILDSGLSPAAAKPGSFKGFLWTLCLFAYRLHGHWGHPESRSSGQRKRPESKDGLCPHKRTY